MLRTWPPPTAKKKLRHKMSALAISDPAGAGSLESVFRALASHDRRALMEALRTARDNGRPTLSIEELALATGVSRFTASRHLAVLREAGLVGMQMCGYRHLHQLHDDALWELEDWLSKFLDHGL